MLTIRQFMAACALAHDLDCEHSGWEYDYDYEEWFGDVVGVVAQPSCAVWLQRPGPDGSMQIQQIDIDVEQLNRAAELIGYLDMF